MITRCLSALLAIAPPDANPAAVAPEPAPTTEAAPAPAAERDPRAVFEAVTKVVAPTVLLETDYRVFSDPSEGRSGLALGRARLGLRLRPTDWLTAVGTAEFIGPDGPYLLDGYARFDATPWLQITVGYSKPPLFASFRHESITAVPMPVRSAVVNEMRVRRDVGVEARFAPRRIPIEAIVRVGNGSTALRGDEDPTPAGYAALDLVLGRAWVGGDERGLGRTLGLRLGGAAMVDSQSEHATIAGATPLGFVYSPGIAVTGLRVIATAHVIAYAGPVRLVVEGGFAQEGREDDPDGDPSTPPVALDPVRSWGLTGELLWTIRGGWREVGGRPGVASVLARPWDGGVVELAARADRFWLGYGAVELARTGGTTGSLGLKWWPTPFLALAGYGEATRFEISPIDTPDRLWGWAAMIRASLFWP